MPQYAIMFDASKCIGCQACEVACKQENDLPAGVQRIHVVAIGPEEIGGKLCLDFSLLRCRHCGKPPCIEACPQNAITKREDGIVLIDNQSCDGCEMCAQVCPFHAPQLNPVSGTVEICTLCVHRIERGLLPACVQNCITGALSFGDISEVASQKQEQKATKA